MGRKAGCISMSCNSILKLSLIDQIAGDFESNIDAKSKACRRESLSHRCRTEVGGSCRSLPWPFESGHESSLAPKAA